MTPFGWVYLCGIPFAWGAAMLTLHITAPAPSEETTRLDAEAAPSEETTRLDAEVVLVAGVIWPVVLGVTAVILPVAGLRHLFAKALSPPETKP